MRFPPAKIFFGFRCSVFPEQQFAPVLFLDSDFKDSMGKEFGGSILYCLLQAMLEKSRRCWEMLGNFWRKINDLGNHKIFKRRRRVRQWFAYALMAISFRQKFPFFSNIKKRNVVHEMTSNMTFVLYNYAHTSKSLSVQHFLTPSDALLPSTFHLHIPQISIEQLMHAFCGFRRLPLFCSDLLIRMHICVCAHLSFLLGNFNPRSTNTKFTERNVHILQNFKTFYTEYQTTS